MAKTKKIKFVPVNKQLLIEIPEAVEQTPSGIYIPQDLRSKERPEQGRVAAKASDCSLPDVFPGTVVLFTKYGPAEIVIDGQQFLVVNEKDLLGYINE